MKINLSETIAYVNKNIVRAQKGRKCVDGRYSPAQASGMIGRPGGDCGYVMALMAVSKQKALGLTPEQCFDIIYKLITNNHEHFSMHTDHNSKAIIGCGHLSLAADKKLSPKYNINSEDVVKLIDYARNIAETSSNLEMINLNGEHAEIGVIIINSKRYTINSQDPELNKMYFIYDEERDNDFLKKLVNDIKISEVTYPDMKKESDLQLQATLTNLAAGLPIYSVKFDGEKPIISSIPLNPFIA